MSVSTQYGNFQSTGGIFSKTVTADVTLTNTKNTAEQRQVHVTVNCWRGAIGYLLNLAGLAATVHVGNETFYVSRNVTQASIDAPVERVRTVFEETIRAQMPAHPAKPHQPGFLKRAEIGLRGRDVVVREARAKVDKVRAELADARRELTDKRDELSQVKGKGAGVEFLRLGLRTCIAALEVEIPRLERELAKVQRELEDLG